MRNSLFSYVVSTIRNAYRNIGIDEKSINESIPMGDWSDYNDDDISVIVIEAAKHVTDCEDDDVDIEFRNFDDNKIAAINITVSIYN